MPPGYLITVLIIGACVAILLARPRPQSRVGTISYIVGGLLINEQPHWYAALLAVITVLAVAQGEITAAGWGAVALAGVVAAGLFVLLARAFPSRDALRTAVARLDEQAVDRLAGTRSYLVALLAPVPLGRALVRRTRNIAYGPAGKANRLDVYRPRGEATGPTLIYLHGGRFRMGDKQRESQLMKYRLARQGWVVISANYRLNPEGKFPDFLIDLKRVVAWARSDGLAFGVDPERILLAGSSAGAHISAMAALTPNRPDLQPGFEEVETSVRGVIGLYGYYGRLNVSGEAARAIPSSPIDLAHPDAPPFLLIDAGHDSVIGPESTKQLLAALETAGSKVARAELPGAEHTFDFLRSVRNENTIDAIEDFAGLACGRRE